MTDPNQPNPIGDYVASWIRTVVPVAWGMLLTWLAALIPAFAPVFNDDATVGLHVVVAGALTTLWYSLWRKVEPSLPPWLTRVLLGANARPTYPAVIDGVPVNPPGRHELR